MDNDNPRPAEQSQKKYPPGKLLHPLQRVPKYAAWGFILDDEQLTVVCDERVDNLIRQDPDNLELQDPAKRPSLWQTQCGFVYTELQNTSKRIWPSANSRVVDTTVKKDLKIALAVVRSTRREDNFLPPPEKVEEMKQFFASYGFNTEPCWFVVRGDD